jgi:hypothetical protein
MRISFKKRTDEENTGDKDDDYQRGMKKKQRKKLI